MSSDNEKTYEVGYGKPPVATRFQKGTSGNPSGRRKKAALLDDPRTVLQSIDNEVIAVIDNGKSLPPASPQDSFSAAASKPGSLPGKDASAGFSESGRLSRLASDGAGRRSFPQGQRSAQDIGSARKRRDTKTAMMSAAAVAVTISPLPDLSNTASISATLGGHIQDDLSIAK